jgi:starch synthase
MGHLEHAQVMQTLLNTALLVVPGRWAEPFGLSVIEAMAAGRPVIATAQGGPMELIEHDLTGLLVPPDEPEALAVAIEDLLNDPERLRRMGQAARERYLLRHRPEAHAAALGRLFSELVDSSRPRRRTA